MKKKQTSCKATPSGEALTHNLNTLAQQLGLYAMLLRNASSKQQSIINS